MSSSGKDFDLNSLASDASLLSKKGASKSKSKKQSLLSRLSGSRGDGESSSTKTAASSSQKPDSKKESNLVEDLYQKYPALGTNTRLT
jgi:hypothetical protein